MGFSNTVNVGILGHVDSGKTSLVRALSTITSTAALDKHPQSQERGITLDLGFSAFMLSLSNEEQKHFYEGSRSVVFDQELLLSKSETVGKQPHAESNREYELTVEDDSSSDIPNNQKNTSANTVQQTKYATPFSSSTSNMHGSDMQVCLVDCPGHATLIRTILSGAQIIDMVILVIDITKGFQTQTSECLVIAEILTTQLIVVLNKVDLIPLDKRNKQIERICEKFRKVFENTAFGASVPMVVVSATGGKKGETMNAIAPSPIGLDDLLACMRKNIRILPRNEKGPLYFAFDHSFPIKGQGTIITGTLLSGSLRVGQHVRIPSHPETSKVRSMQMFKNNIEIARQGDRVAICLPSISSTKLERGMLIDAKDFLPNMYGCIAVVQRIRYFKGKILNGTKFHCTIGHNTTMCYVNFFALCTDETMINSNLEKQKSFSAQSSTLSVASLSQGNLVLKNRELWPQQFDFNATYHHLNGLPLINGEFLPFASKNDENLCQNLPCKPQLCFAVLRFERCIQCPPESLLICSKFDEETTTSNCRLAFFGKIVFCLEKLSTAPSKASNISNGIIPSLDCFTDLPRVLALKHKVKFGKIDRFVSNDPFALIGKSLFKDSDHLSHFIGCTIDLICDASKYEATMKVTGDVNIGVNDYTECSLKIKGILEKSFGKSGKFLVRFSDSLPPANALVDPYLILRFARSAFDKHGQILQK